MALVILMFNFFCDSSKRVGNCYIIEGADYNHIKNVLRMTVGDSFLVNCEGRCDLCRITALNNECVTAEIECEAFQNTNLPIEIYLFEGLPKADKMELIIQKCVELGVHEIIPTEMEHCVVKLEEKKKASKVARWQAISESAAKQSKRNTVPKINDVLSYREALTKASELDVLLVPYENERGMSATEDALIKIKSGMRVGIIIGPEGGFSEKEIEAAKNIGGNIISLGKRILRTETAAITAVGMCMLYSEMRLNYEEPT